MYILMATSLRTNVVVVTRIHSSSKTTVSTTSTVPVPEFYHCERDGDRIVLSLSFKWYKWSGLIPLIYEDFIGGGTEEIPDGVQTIYVETTVGGEKICSANFSDPDTATSNATHTIRIPVSIPVAATVECGTYYVSSYDIVFDLLTALFTQKKKKKKKKKIQQHSIRFQKQMKTPVILES